MAAIDKLYLSDYYDFNDFRIWCIKYKPELLWQFYGAFYTWNDWDKMKENAYKETFKRVNDFYIKYPSSDDYVNSVADYDKKESAKIYWLSMYNEWNTMGKYKDDWKWEHSIPVCNFSLEEDEWLHWHCPLKPIRAYLENQCGYKTKWYHKLFWKGKKYA